MLTASLSVTPNVTASALPASLNIAPPTPPVVPVPAWLDSNLPPSIINPPFSTYKAPPLPPKLPALSPALLPTKSVFSIRLSVSVESK